MSDIGWERAKALGKEAVTLTREKNYLKRMKWNGSITKRNMLSSVESTA